MPKAGEIRVRTCQDELSKAVRMLRYRVGAKSIRRPTLLAGEDYYENKNAKLKALLEQLEKSLKRKRRSSSFTICVNRDLAEEYLSECRNVFWSVTVRPGQTAILQPIPWSGLSEAIEVALKQKRGRPRLGNKARLARLEKSYAIDERHRKRLRRSHKRDEAWEKWNQELRERGETLLTATTPPPKI